MRWQDLRPSSNIQDLRGGGGRGAALGGGGIVVLILAGLVWLCGGDPSQLLENFPSTQTQVERQQPNTAANRGPQPADQNRQFAERILGSTEDVWSKLLPQQARVRYVAPKLVLFTDQISSACGYASAASGPFYCPGDQKLYLDFSFFNELRSEFKAPGDFAQAYVIAHEVGHHIQNLLGTMERVQRAGNNNQLSVALELQADCYAGVWAYNVQQQGVVEAGDAEEAIRAAGAVGDDIIQKRTQGYAVPDSFTHGTAQQRITYFSKGFQTGDMRQCQTVR